nr:phospholipase D-like domain-containing protein [uncultured Rhodopila sp.]
MRGLKVLLPFSMTFAVALAGPAAQVSGQPADPNAADAAVHGPAPALVGVCFVPARECDTPVVQAIAGARTSIRVQAYGFTSQVILQALADARARGVDVQAILDKSDDKPEREGQRKRHLSGAHFTAEANIPTWIDDSVSIAHNKVIIIDGHLVVGGSYNYTAAAERRNAENVTFIDAPVVADFYLVNWEARKAVSRLSRYEPVAEADSPRSLASVNDH